MPTFSEAVQESGRLALCALFAGNEAVNALLSPLTGDSLGLYPLTSGLRRKLCSDDPGNDPSYTPEFTGGQCPVNYTVSYQLRRRISGEWIYTATNTRTVLGPVSIAKDNPEGVNCNPEVDGLTTANAALYSGTGAKVLTLANLCVDEQPGYRIISVVRQDGQPDNCGDPPPPPSVPGPITTNPPDITYNIDGDTTITVPISFTFSPAYIDIDGSVEIPVTFEVDGINFDGTVTVSPEFNFEFSPSFDKPGPGAPDDPDAIGEPGGGAEPIPDVEDLPSTIIGVLVYSDVIAEEGTGSILFVNGPDIYIPRVASVQFAVKTADSIGWTPDQDVKNLESYVPCPAPQGAIAVRVSPMPGIQSRFTPVRGKPLTSF